jgi:hypothetical protein
VELLKEDNIQKVGSSLRMENIIVNNGLVSLIRLGASIDLPASTSAQPWLKHYVETLSCSWIVFQPPHGGDSVLTCFSRKE